MSISSSIIEGYAMTDLVAIRNPSRCPTHPGEILAEAVGSVDVSKTELAVRLGISRQHLHDITTCRKPVTPSVAVRLGKLFGNGAGLWMRMQTAYDLWHAEREVDTSGIVTLTCA